MRQKGFAPIIILLIVLIIAVGAVYFYSSKSVKNSNNTAQTTPIPSVETSKTFTSTELGISFNYTPQDIITANKTSVTIASGNGSSENLTIEIFNKDKNISLKKEIENKFLKDKAICEVNSGAGPRGVEAIGDHAVEAVVINTTSEVQKNSQDPGGIYSAIEKCGGFYSILHGWFAENLDYPEKYIFIGEGPQVKAGSDMVHETLKIIN